MIPATRLISIYWKDVHECDINGDADSVFRRASFMASDSLEWLVIRVGYVCDLAFLYDKGAEIA